MKRYRISAKARIDLAEIWLAQFPGIGQRRDDLREGIRTLPVGSYLIVYRPVSDGVERRRIGLALVDQLRFEPQAQPRQLPQPSTGIECFAGCGIVGSPAGVAHGHREIAQPFQSGPHPHPSRLDPGQRLKQDVQVVSLAEGEACFVQSRLQILLGALL